MSEAGQRESHLAVTRTARYAVLGSGGPHTREVWLACHGYGQLAARFLRRFEVLDDGRRQIVAPEALNRFYLDGGTGPHGPASRVGATWMTREDRLTDIEDYIRYIEAVYEVTFATVDRSTVRFVAVGFSQGVSTICRWAARTNARIDHLILWSGTLPPELSLTPDPFRGAEVTFVLGNRDPWATDETVLGIRERTEQAGREIRLIRFDGGHDIHSDVLLQVAQSGPSL